MLHLFKLLLEYPTNPFFMFLLSWRTLNWLCFLFLFSQRIIGAVNGALLIGIIASFTALVVILPSQSIYSLLEFELQIWVTRISPPFFLFVSSVLFFGLVYVNCIQVYQAAKFSNYSDWITGSISNDNVIEFDVVLFLCIPDFILFKIQYIYTCA